MFNKASTASTRPPEMSVLLDTSVTANANAFTMCVLLVVAVVVANGTRPTVLGKGHQGGVTLVRRDTRWCACKTAAPGTEACLQSEVEMYKRIEVRRSQPNHIHARVLVPEFVSESTSVHGAHQLYVSAVGKGNTLCEVYANASTPSRAVAKHLLHTLAFLHDTCGIVHGDVKPANIVVDDHGAPYLVDFGSACLVGGVLECPTLPFAAPEWLEDPTRKAAPTMDLFALGVTLYRRLHNHREPFPTNYRAPTTEEYAKALQPQWRNGPTFAAGTDPIVQSVVTQLLAYEPAARGTASDLLCQLDAA